MVHRAAIGDDCRGPVAEASTREQCNALYPGSNPGRASKIALTATSAGGNHLAFRKLQAVGVARRGFDDGIEQAREARIQILTAKLHVARGADDAGLDQAR